MRELTPQWEIKTLRCSSTTTTTLLKEKIISGVKNESNDKGTGHMRKETRDDENEKDNEDGDAWWRCSGNETKRSNIEASNTKENIQQHLCPNMITKGALAQESRTSTQLFSPATGCEKKKKTSLEQGLRMQN